MNKIAFLFCVLLALPARSATWVSNKDHSEIHFTVPYMSVSEVTGRFNEFTSEVELSPEGLPNGKVLIHIKTSTIDTGNKMRDQHLRDSSFFYVQSFPDAVFESKTLKAHGKKWLSDGVLTIRGIAKPAQVEFTRSEIMKDTWGYETVFIKFNSSVNRKDYNMNWNKTLDGQEFLVGDKVAISGVLQLQMPRKKTANSKHMIPDNEYIRNRDSERQKTESTFSQKIRSIINGK